MLSVKESFCVIEYLLILKHTKRLLHYKACEKKKSMRSAK